MFVATILLRINGQRQHKTLARAKTPAGIMRQLYAWWRRELTREDFSWNQIEIGPE